MKTVKMINLFLALLLTILCFTSCSNNAKQIEKRIDIFLTTEEKSQEILDCLFEDYNSLSKEQKEKVNNYQELSKYENVDLNKINKLNSDIKNLSELSKFKSLLSLKETYDKLTSNEKALVDFTDIENMISLNDLEKAAISSCQYIKSSLKSAGSFKLYECSVVNDLNGTTGYYLVNIKYSAQNSFGADLDDISFQTIDKNFKNPWYPIALITGEIKEALECTPYYSYFLSSKSQSKLDIEKILYYINEDVKN